MNHIRTSIPPSTGNVIPHIISISLPPLELGEGERNKTFTIRKGQDIIIRLNQSNFDKSEWRIIDTDRSLAYPSQVNSKQSSRAGQTIKEFTWNTRDNIFVGGGSTHQITVGLCQPWETRPTLEYKFFIKIN